MYITKEEIIENVKKDNRRWAEQLYNHDCPNEWRTEFKVVYDKNYGDGNEYIVCIEFINHNLFILLEGTYSSWDSPSWDSLSFGEPFEYTETRFKPVTFEYLRDKKIESVLSKDEEK